MAFVLAGISASLAKFAMLIFLLVLVQFLHELMRIIHWKEGPSSY